MLNILRQVQGWVRIKGSASNFLDLLTDAYARQSVPVKSTWSSNNNNFKSDLVVKNNSATHSVTVAADSWLTQVHCSSTCELAYYRVSVNAVNRFSCVTGVGHYNHTINLASPIKVLNGQTVSIFKENLSSKDVDLETTIVLESVDG